MRKLFLLLLALAPVPMRAQLVTVPMRAQMVTVPMRAQEIPPLAQTGPDALPITNPALVPMSRLALNWWRSRWDLTLAQARAVPGAKIVWLGDSITQYWQRDGGHGYDNIQPVWAQYYAPYQALDFGFIGDTTANLIWRLEHGQVTGLHPQLAIILIGANNFGAVRWDAAQTVPGIEAVVRLTHQLLPGAHILLLGVLPSIRSSWVDAQTLQSNAALGHDYQGDPVVSFIDLSPLFMRNGAVDGTLFIDPRMTPPRPALHPDAAGMRDIAVALAPFVADYVK